jgi:hypothetical protein
MPYGNGAFVLFRGTPVGVTGWGPSGSRWRVTTKDERLIDRDADAIVTAACFTNDLRSCSS